MSKNRQNGGKILSVFILICFLSAFCLITKYYSSKTDHSFFSFTDGQYKKQTRTVFAMDTVMDLTIYVNKENTDAEKIMGETEELLHELEAKLSVTDSGSEIYKINHEKKAAVSPDTAWLIENALLLCERTEGALDISIYPVVSEWGFTNGNYHVPDSSLINSLLQKTDYSMIKIMNADISIENGMAIDLGSVAKGYTGDKITALLSERGVTSALLNLGGNVQAIGSKPDGSPWRVAITDPKNTNAYLGYLDITDKAVITSGGYQRYFEEDQMCYHHIIDPSTGYPAANGLASVTIVGNSGLLCDALSTSLFVMGLDKASQFWRESDDFEAVFVDEHNTIYITEGLNGNFRALNDSEIQVIRK